MTQARMAYSKRSMWMIGFLFFCVTVSSSGQENCGCQSGGTVVELTPSECCPSDVMDTRNYRLIDYRRMFKKGVTPTSEELVGHWRGVNKGVVEFVGYRQFIKEIKPVACHISGDNIQVEQVSKKMLRCVGWQPKTDDCTGELKRRGKFLVLPPSGIGAFKHGVVFSYARGGNRKRDPSRLLVDKVVKIDENHLLGRATANFGPFRIPLSYFVLERM